MVHEWKSRQLDYSKFLDPPTRAVLDLPLTIFWRISIGCKSFLHESKESHVLFLYPFQGLALAVGTYQLIQHTIIVADGVFP